MLAIIRAPLLLVAFVLLNIVLLLICIFRPFHRNNVHAAGQLYCQMAKVMGMKLELRVDEHFDNSTPSVVIANHQNSYDVITICKAAFPGVVTIGKKSLKWIPVFGQVYWLSGNILIDRQNKGRAKGTLDLAAKKMKEKNLSIWMFPEGTRSYGRGLLPFKAGAFKLAKATGAPIVTITASSTQGQVKWNRWNNGTVIIDVSAPKPIDESMSVKEAMESYHTGMKSTLARLDQEVAELNK